MDPRVPSPSGRLARRTRGPPARTYTKGGKIGDYRRHSTLLDANGAYFECAKRQYEDKAVGDFMHIKDMGVTGDGYTDDTAAFQAALYASQGRILLIDAGSYILTSTIAIPSGTKIASETWLQLVASGSYFEDASNPQVLIQVGTVGNVGDVEIQNILFTTRGTTADLILIEWNIQAPSVAFPIPPAGVVARGVTPYHSTLDWPTVDQYFLFINYQKLGKSRTNPMNEFRFTFL
ncbi:pectin lyase-like protein [Colletotrichum eremochloae]|nr:pectin lyase-like protein [Colletotrichum eremochloae]